MSTYDFEPDPSDDDEEERGQVTCKRCQAQCTWHHTGVRWVLLDEDAHIHSCGAVASTDDFDDVST